VLDDDEGLEPLTRDEIRSLRHSAPERLFRHLSRIQRQFLFGVAARRSDPQGWGGEWELTINRNLVLHFVPGWNRDMTCREELPQFSVLPSEERPDTSEDTVQVLDDDGEEIAGVVFWVDPGDYAQMTEELAEVAERYGDLDIVPDTYFLDTTLIDFLARVVLEHPTVRVEREFDWKRGLIGGVPPSDEPVDEPELERIEDEEDPDTDEELLGGASQPEQEYDVTEGQHLRTIKFRPPRAEE
jgi:hypothetical protein